MVSSSFECGKCCDELEDNDCPGGGTERKKKPTVPTPSPTTGFLPANSHIDEL